jgi:hypothetical protein
MLRLSIPKRRQAARRTISTPTLPIRVHLVLTILCTWLGLFAGATVGVVSTILLAMGLGIKGVWKPLAFLWLGTALFWAGAALGLNLGQALAIKWLPARCPHCGGRIYYQRGRPILYRCASCGHVHVIDVDET